MPNRTDFAHVQFLILLLSITPFRCDGCEIRRWRLLFWRLIRLLLSLSLSQQPGGLLQLLQQVPLHHWRCSNSHSIEVDFPSAFSGWSFPWDRGRTKGAQRSTAANFMVCGGLLGTRSTQGWICLDALRCLW